MNSLILPSVAIRTTYPNEWPADSAIRKAIYEAIWNDPFGSYFWQLVEAGFNYWLGIKEIGHYNAEDRYYPVNRVFYVYNQDSKIGYWNTRFHLFKDRADNWRALIDKSKG